MSGVDHQHTTAAALQAITRDSLTAVPFTLAGLEPAPRRHNLPALLSLYHSSPAGMRREAYWLARAMPGRIAWQVRRAFRFARTCTHAAKLLPTVRRAIPWYVYPILVVATIVKMMPLDFGTDEALFALAFALIAWRRPGLLKALYREAQAGKPAPCQCARHAPSVARELVGVAR